MFENNLYRDTKGDAGEKQTDLAFSKDNIYLSGSLRRPLEEERKKRIIVKKGKAFVVMNLESIAIFYFDKLSFALDFSGNKYLVKENLTELEKVLDPFVFFRINRETIINIEAVKEFSSIKGGKILIQMVPLQNEPKEISVSQSSAPQFRQWINSL